MLRIEKLLVPRPRNSALLWLIAAAALLATVQVAKNSWTELQTMRQERATLARLRSLMNAPPPRPQSREEKERAKRWAGLQKERDFRWYPVFLALEKANNADIELLEFAPDKVSRTFVLRGEARDMPTLLAYVEQLAVQPAFANVYLAHQKSAMREQLATQIFEVRGHVKQ